MRRRGGVWNAERTDGDCVGGPFRRTEWVHSRRRPSGRANHYRPAADFKDPAGRLIRPAAVLNTEQHIAHTPTTRLRHQHQQQQQRRRRRHWRRRSTLDWLCVFKCGLSDNQHHFLSPALMPHDTHIHTCWYRYLCEDSTLASIHFPLFHTAWPWPWPEPQHVQPWPEPDLDSYLNSKLMMKFGCYRRHPPVTWITYRQSAKSIAGQNHDMWSLTPLHQLYRLASGSRVVFLQDIRTKTCFSDC